MIKKLFEEFQETFFDIMGWTIVCALGCIPGFGTMIAFPILFGLKLIFEAIYLGPIAQWLCESTYQSRYYIDLVAIDLIRIWIISYVLISFSRIILQTKTDRAEN